MAKVNRAASSQVNLRITAEERGQLARLCAHMKCTVADLFRMLVLEQAAELDAPPPPEPKAGKAAPPPPEAMGKGKGKGKIDLARVNAETTWPVKKLDAAVLAQLGSYKGRGPHSLGPLMVHMEAKGVVPGRVQWSLHRLETAGLIKLRHGKLSTIDAPLRTYLPTDDRDKHYVAASLVA